MGTFVERNGMQKERGFTLWFTGLSGAGKTTIAEIVEHELRERGRRVEVLDGDIVRTNLSKGLGFDREDRNVNVLRIGFVANLLTRNGVSVIVSAISPYKEARDQVRRPYKPRCCSTSSNSNAAHTNIFTPMGSASSSMVKRGWWCG